MEKSNKKTEHRTKKPITRNKAAKVATTRKKEESIPVGYSIFKSDKLPTVARAYDKRNGLQVWFRNKKYIPKWVKQSLTNEEISRMLLTNDTKK